MMGEGQATWTGLVNENTALREANEGLRATNANLKEALMLISDLEPDSEALDQTKIARAALQKDGGE